MGTTPFNEPLAPPHRAAWGGPGRQDIGEEIESMLPKELLKYSEKVAPEQIEKRVADIVKRCSKNPTDGLTPVGAGQVMPLQIAQAQAVQRNLVDAYIQQLQRLNFGQ